MGKSKLDKRTLNKIFEDAGIMFCPKCKRGYLLDSEKEFIEAMGECSYCHEKKGSVKKIRERNPKKRKKKC